MDLGIGVVGNLSQGPGQVYHRSLLAGRQGLNPDFVPIFRSSGAEWPEGEASHMVPSPRFSLRVCFRTNVSAGKSPAQLL